jgi:hypothetical protein
VFAGRASTSFSSRINQQRHWVTNVIGALQVHMQPGDVLAVMNFKGDLRLAAASNFWEQTILRDTLRPRNASLFLVGDNPVLSGRPTVCRSNHRLCQPRPDTMAAIREHDAERIQFAAERDDVFSFTQTQLWSENNFWGNVPGTATNAFYDTHHLLRVGAMYLAPYLCSSISDMLLQLRY